MSDIVMTAIDLLTQRVGALEKQVNAYLNPAKPAKSGESWQLMREDVKKMRQDIAIAEGILKAIQADCKHPLVEKKHRGDTGNYDPSCDRYWTELYCPECDKTWTEPGAV